MRAAVKAELNHNGVQATASAWAEESCAAVAVPGFYPESRQLGAEYQARWATTLVTQLAAATRRLAFILNQALLE